MRAPESIVITGASIARQEDWAGVISTPARASRSAGSNRSRHGIRPKRACSASRPAGDAGHGERRRPDRVVDELLAERHLQLDSSAPSPDGIAQKQSRFHAPPDAASQ